MVRSAVVKVVGIAGAGIIVMENMINHSIFAANCIAVDSDDISLHNSSASVKIKLDLSKIKNCAANAEETCNEIRDALQGSDMIILVAGMGGETGTRAIQMVASSARKLGIDLIIGIVTLPSSLEDEKLHKFAEAGISALGKLATSLIVIPNDDRAGFNDLTHIFKSTDAILVEAAVGLSGLVLPTGLMAVDIEDVKRVLPSECAVTFGFGEAAGAERALDAFNKALLSLSCGGADIADASGVLINITGSADMTMYDYNSVNRILHEKVHADANIKIGVDRDDALGEKVKVLVYLVK